MSFEVTSWAGEPSGDVTVADGPISCTAPAQSGSCTLSGLLPGDRTLTLTYEGDEHFAGAYTIAAYFVEAQAPQFISTKLGAYTDGAWLLDKNGDFAFQQANEQFGWGSPGNIPVPGDWNGDGKLDLGVFSDGLWFVDLNGDGIFDAGTEFIGWGVAGWIPVVGDWNGDGRDKVGAFDGGLWFIDFVGDQNFDPATDFKGWGVGGWTPVPGKW